jgi:hypothetical protein
VNLTTPEVCGPIAHLLSLMSLWYVLDKADPCGRSLPGIAGSNPAASMDVCVLRMLCVVCDGPIPRPGESYECVC